MKKPPAKRSQQPSSPTENGQTRIEVHQSQMWKAPLPPPSVLSDFDNVVPGAAERIINAWEAEGNHRRMMDWREQRAYYRDALVGKVFALIFVLAALSLAAWAVYKGEAWIGAILGTGLIGSVVWAFIHQRKPK